MLMCHLLFHWFSQSLLIACQIPSLCFCNDSYICFLQLFLSPNSLSPFLHFLPVLIHYCPINDSETIFSKAPRRLSFFRWSFFMSLCNFSLNCAPRWLFHIFTLLFNSQNSYLYFFFCWWPCCLIYWVNWSHQKRTFTTYIYLTFSICRHIVCLATCHHRWTFYLLILAFVYEVLSFSPPQGHCYNNFLLSFCHYQQHTTCLILQNFFLTLSPLPATALFTLLWNKTLPSNFVYIHYFSFLTSHFLS